MAWQLHEAKQKFSEVVELAITNGPQIVTRNGKEVAAVISIEDYRRNAQPERSFTQFLLEGPFFDVDDQDFERQRDFPREIEL